MFGRCKGVVEEGGGELDNALVKWGDEGELGLWGRKGSVDGMNVMRWVAGRGG